MNFKKILIFARASFYVTLRCVTLCYIMLRYVTLCYVLCYVCYVTICFGTLDFSRLGVWEFGEFGILGPWDFGALFEMFENMKICSGKNTKLLNYEKIVL